jgi:RNA polymerase sigma factor (TIGR02999 family)
VRAPQEDVTQLIRRWQGGDDHAFESLLPLIYADLRAMAARLMAHGEGATLQPTALVHDAFVRLLGGSAFVVNDTEHLLNIAARTMRLVLIDRLRRKQRDRHGGKDARQVDMVAALDLPIPDQTDLERLNEAIDELHRFDERLAKVVELRYFVGLSVPQVAAVFGVDKRTIYRDWAIARSWLRRHMQK